MMSLTANYLLPTFVAMSPDEPLSLSPEDEIPAHHFISECTAAVP